METGYVTDAEVPAVIELWRRCGLAEHDEEALDDLRRARASASSAVLVGRIEGQVRATALVGFDGHRAWSYYVAVDPDVQGTGLGRSIMMAARAWAKDRGAPKLMLLVADNNRKVLGFYRALGFHARPFTPLARPL